MHAFCCVRFKYENNHNDNRFNWAETQEITEKKQQHPKATHYLYIHNHCDTFFIFTSYIAGIFFPNDDMHFMNKIVFRFESEKNTDY